VTLRLRKLIAALGGVVLTLTATRADDPLRLLPTSTGTEPGRLELTTPTAAPAHNQHLADAVAGRLNQLSLKGYRIDIRVAGGIVELVGFVSSPQHHDQVLGAVRSVPGVHHVVDRIEVWNQTPLVQTQLLQPTPEPGPLPQREGGVAPLLQNQPEEPAPIFQPPPQGPTAQGHEPPRLPPYAWPTYAPYNNYSRVAYPLTYPSQSWPFIGPIHPYPKVPLGWRSVSLTWQDGFWWYGRNATGYDWWRLRFW
jgi:hypothetical protein